VTNTTNALLSLNCFLIAFLTGYIIHWARSSLSRLRRIEQATVDAALAAQIVARSLVEDERKAEDERIAARHARVEAAARHVSPVSRIGA
jgi:hypothetical protein